MKLTKEEIRIIYTKVAKVATKAVERKLYVKALHYIETSAMWAYNFNFIYTDKAVEDAIKHIANVKLSSVKLIKPHAKRFVVIDSFALDNRGLTQQYIRAMMVNDVEILFLLTSGSTTHSTETLRELANYSKAKVYVCHKEATRFEKCSELLKQIAAFQPSKLFLHLTPWDTVALMVTHRVRGVEKFNINLTDHAYWMGASFIDYNLEFRSYGMTESFEMRGLKQEQLLELPYYPIQSKWTEFQDFPELPPNCVKIFTGGALYKILGEDDIFFKLMDAILDVSPKAMILVAGFNRNGVFDIKRAGMKHADRVVEIGVRKDIDAVFQNIDIYLGTYPMSGGLMSQFAATHAKPILSYAFEGDVMNKVSQIVCHYEEVLETYSSFDKLQNYALRLINDAAYRQAEGMKLKAAMIDEARFNEEFMHVVTTHQNSFHWSLTQNINYEFMFERYVDLENTMPSAMRQLVYNLKLQAFTLFPQYACGTFLILLRAMYGRIKMIKYKFANVL